MPKTVIMVWTKTDSGTHPNGSVKTYGLGDLLRGTIYLHQMSVELGFNFIVDIRFHPISQYLIMNSYDNKEYVNANLNKIQIIHCHEPDKFKQIYEESLECSDPLLICTNMFCMDDLSTDCKQFMRTLLMPNEPFKKYINKQNELYQVSSKYSIIHIRLGDDEFCRNKSRYNFNIINVNNAINIIKKFIEPQDILMSNSFRLKQQLKLLNTNIKMFNTRPLHLGELSTMFHENIIESFSETLYEFFVLTNASNIKTYSVYEWVSGFVKFAGLIYDIPLVDLKQEQLVDLKQEQLVDLKQEPIIHRKETLQESIQTKPTIKYNNKFNNFNNPVASFNTSFNTPFNTSFNTPVETSNQTKKFTFGLKF